jgi:hypothetical protein
VRDFSRCFRKIDACQSFGSSVTSRMCIVADWNLTEAKLCFGSAVRGADYVAASILANSVGTRFSTWFPAALRVAESSMPPRQKRERDHLGR